MTDDRRWTALLLAGQRPGENAFAAGHGVAAKALIPVLGEPMLGRVARTLLAAPSIRSVVILAQDPERLIGGDLSWLDSEPRVSLAEAGDGISQSILGVAGTARAPWPLLVVTADHVLLTTNMVEDFLGAVGGEDLAVALVERRTVEARYPATRRTWIRFSDGDFTGANLFALCCAAARPALSVWAEVEQDRKKAMAVLWKVGPLVALRAATRTISLDGALAHVARRAGLSARAIRLPQAEAAIDVDKPEDLRLAERILAART